MNQRLKVAVIGGGISGMAAAYELTRNPAVEVTLLERNPRAGGVLQTEHRDGWIFDHAADNFIVQPDAAVQLCEEIGITDQLVSPSADDRRALIVHEGKLVATPEGLALMRPTRLRSVLTTPLLSWRAKLRLMIEPLIPRKKNREDESLASFVRRRLGNEFLERIVQPLIAGIYTGDAELLSVQATVPQVVEMEQKYGSLFRATLATRRSGSEKASRQASGARYGQFRALKNGSHGLIEAIESKLPQGTVRLAHEVRSITRDDSGQWRIETEGGYQGSFDGVVLALPAPSSARLLETACPVASQELKGIAYASSAIALLGIRASDLPKPLEGFGFVVPQIEGREVLSVSYASKKYPGRAPEGFHLLRVFMGGALRPDLMQFDDQALIAKACKEVRELLGLKGDPVLTKLVRWEQRMPQYHVGHVQRIARVREALSECRGLVVAGNGMDGVGIPQCVRTAREGCRSMITALLV